MNVVSAVFLVVFAVIGICAFVRELTFFSFVTEKIIPLCLLLPSAENVKMLNIFCEVLPQR